MLSVQVATRNRDSTSRLQCRVYNREAWVCLEGLSEARTAPELESVGQVCYFGRYRERLPRTRLAS
eukprot:3937161-Rhodomonas_salina.2